MALEKGLKRGGRYTIGRTEKWPEKSGGGRNRGENVGRKEKMRCWE